MIQVNENITVEDMIKALEPVMRRIIREELMIIADSRSEIFSLIPDSPLYDDMLNIKQRKENGELEFYSHNEVWGE